MKVRPISLVFLWGGVGLGCSNWLGLDDLRFASGSGGSPTSGTGGQGPEVGPGSGGDVYVPEPPDLLEIATDSFPSTWPEDTLFAVEQGTSGDPYYFAYEPTAHKLSVLRLVQGQDFIASSTWAPDETWTHLVVISSSTGPVLLGYDSIRGVLERAHDFQEDGSFESSRSSGNQHTHLLVWPFADARVLFAYDQNTGFYRGVPATTQDEVPVMQGTIEAGWSQVVSTRDDQGPALLFYEPTTGQFALYRQGADGLDLVGEGQIVVDCMALTWPAASGFALYDAELGAINWFDVAEHGGLGGAGGGVLATSFWDSTLYVRRSLTWMESFAHGYGQALLSFDGEVLDLNFPASDEEDGILR